MSDLGHRLTDKELDELERRLAAVYKRANREVLEKVDKYFSAFERKDLAMMEQVAAGEITEQDLANWRYNQMAVGKRWTELREDMAATYLDANKQAAGMMNDTARSVFALNHNYAAYTLERQVGANLNFSLYDSDAVARLIQEEPTLLPPKRVMPAKDQWWNMQNFAKEVTQGILQGESAGKLANRVQNVTEANRVSAVRAARTAITGAECAGRVDSYKRAEQMGIKLQKEWMATLDSRTRHSHAELDGTKVDNDKKFPNGCMYPGDPKGKPAEVYNCRCTLVAALADVDELDPVYRRTKNGVTKNKTYNQWVKEKTAQGSENG